MSSDATAGARGQRASIAGQEIVLTPTEYRLLEVLRSQPGEVLTRAELVSKVMPEAIVLERTIDVHIKSLRKKLGALAALIRTVPRRGYLFDPGAAAG